MSEIITPEQPKAREKLSDEQMGNLLSSVGNHEAKAITLLLMRSGNIYTLRNLYSEILNAQGEQKGWRMNKNVPFNYCATSLAPIGLVAKETFGSDLSTFAYSITDYGKEIGIPLAGLLLDFSERHKIPLNLLFGSTMSSSKSKTIQTEEDIEFRKRSPSTTLKILYGLFTLPSLPIRQTDLAERIGEKYSLLPHLIRLSKLNLIQYNSVEINKQYSSYKLSATTPEGEIPIYKRSRTLTNLVFDILKNHPNQYLTLGDIYNLLPKEQRETWKNERNLHALIANISFFLTQHKYIDIEKFSSEKQSEINTTDVQRIILAELLEIMDRFQDQDREIVEKGRKLAGDIISKPNKMSSLLKRAKEASSFANRSFSEETKAHILYIISSNLGITNKGMQELLEEEYEKKLSVKRISRLSASLLEQKSIRVKEEGNLKRFYPNS